MKDILLNLQSLELVVQISLWIIGILMAVIGALSAFALWYIVKVFRGTEENGRKISKVRQESISFRQTIGDAILSLQTSQGSIRGELHKLRRAVVSGTMVLRRRKQEINKLLAESKQSKDQLEVHQDHLQKAARIFRRHRSEFQLIRTKLVELNDELTLVTEDKDAKTNGKGDH